MNIGSIVVEPILDGNGLVAASQFFESITAADWVDHRQYLTEDGMWDFPVGGYLVRTADRVALVDTGLGPRVRSFMRGGRLLESLAEVGVEPADVTDVVLTHLHADHIGWAWHHGEPTFPRATYRCHAADWEYFTRGQGTAHLDPAAEPAPGSSDEAARWMDILIGIEDRVEMWDRDGTVLPGVDLVMAPGHTPGSTLVVVSSGTGRAVIVGDAVHCPVQFTDTDWAVGRDVDPVASTRVRERLVRELEGTDTTVGGPHFPEMKFGRVLVGEGQRRWVVS